MNKTPDGTLIFGRLGAHEIIERWLDGRGGRFDYQDDSASALLPEINRDGAELLERIYGAIESKWQAYGKPCTGKKNWQLHPRKEATEAKRTEVFLERQISKRLQGWHSQMPTWSGLFGGRSVNSSVDLVQASRSTVGKLTRLVFYELKTGSNTPWFAAMEAVCHAALYLMSHDYQGELGYEELEVLRDPTELAFRVLAPRKYYACYSKCDAALRELEGQLNDGLARFGDARDLSMTFTFEQFPEGFTGVVDDCDLEQVVNRISPRYSP